MTELRKPCGWLERSERLNQAPPVASGMWGG